jgi:CO/xanthine dehydrogenase FAD-binding subunit
VSFRPNEYFKAQNEDEVLEILVEHGEEAALIAGGTVFHELVAKGMVPQVKKLVDISGLNLSYIRTEGNSVRIGATTRLCDIRDHDLFRADSPYAAVGEAARILPIQVVELGTIGGNICAGLPILNFPPVIIALNAELRVLGPNGQRSIPADEFYMDYFLTGLQPNEFLAEIRIPELPDRTATVFQASKILSLDYPTISAATRLTLDADMICQDLGIVFGSVGRIPVRVTKAEDRFRGQKLDDQRIRQVAEVIPTEIEPISDLRATAEYRKEMSKVLAEDTLVRASERITQ